MFLVRLKKGFCCTQDEYGHVMPMISVIVPVYNNVQYIEKCISSILSQTYPEYEVIIIDDGSTDGSGECCDQLAQNPRVTVFHQDNSGVSVARNKGIEIAKGQYITFVDSDDYVYERYLEVLAKKVAPGGLSVCKWSSTPKRSSFVDKSLDLTPANAQISAFSSEGIQGVSYCKLFDRDLILKYNLRFNTDITICEDLLFVIQYLYYAKGKITASESVQYYYRPNPSGLLQSRFNPNLPFSVKMLSETKAIDCCHDYLVSKPEVEKAWKMRSVKAAVASLRTLSARKIKEDDNSKLMLKHVRKNTLSYCSGKTGAFSSKISVAVCAVSPILEFKLWKKMNR